ncbi:hypothetical protein V8E36_000175 [Tilletia maclaganii]
MLLYPSTPALVRSDEQLAKQTALSHAMGALFLESRVQDLEQSVERARRQQQHQHWRRRGGGCRSFAVDGGPSGSGSRVRTGVSSEPASHSGSLRVNQHRPRPLAASTLVAAGGTATRSDRDRTIRDPSWRPVGLSASVPSLKGKERSLEYARGIRVVDVSVLIYSLRSVNAWLREGKYTLIVPYGALHTLDLLKNGKETINHVARKALCYVEEKLSEGSPWLSTDPSSASTSGPASASTSSSPPRPFAGIRSRPGLFIQRDEDCLEVSELDEIRRRQEAQEELESLIADIGAGPSLGDSHSATQGERSEEAEDEEDIILVSSISAVHECGQDNASSRSNSATPPEASVPPFRLTSVGSTPRHIQEVLTCALWTRSEASRRRFGVTDPSSSVVVSASTRAEGSSQSSEWDAPFALAVAYPPSGLRSPHPDAEALPAPGRGPNHASLADGSILHRWALSYGLKEVGPAAMPSANASSITSSTLSLDGEMLRGKTEIEVLPTASSWLEMDKQVSMAGGDSVGGKKAKAARTSSRN